MSIYHERLTVKVRNEEEGDGTGQKLSGEVLQWSSRKEESMAIPRAAGALCLTHAE